MKHYIIHLLFDFIMQFKISQVKYCVGISLSTVSFPLNRKETPVATNLLIIVRYFISGKNVLVNRCLSCLSTEFPIIDIKLVNNVSVIVVMATQV